MGFEVTSIQNQFFYRNQRTILGYNDREIGEMIGCKASSVRMYLTRARRKAMKLISEVNQIDSL